LTTFFKNIIFEKLESQFTIMKYVAIVNSWISVTWTQTSVPQPPNAGELEAYRRMYLQMMG